MTMKKHASVRCSVMLHIGDTTGVFHSFDGLPDGKEHLAIRINPEVTPEVPLVRIHSECMTGDLFGSLHCDCGQQLREAINKMKSAGGYLLYLRQEGRGIGLYSKLDAYLIQQTKGLDTFEANHDLGFLDDHRDYTSAIEMLKALGVSRCNLLTNNPLKAESLETGGIRVMRTISTKTYFTNQNREYIEAKINHAHHNYVLEEVDVH